jgi:hypothetical protein
VIAREEVATDIAFYKKRALVNLVSKMKLQPGWETTQGVLVNIPMTGGTLQSADNRVLITIPPNAITQPTNFRMTTLSKPGATVGILGSAHTSFRFSAMDSSICPTDPFYFSSPITITLTYQDSDITFLKEDKLILYYWDTSSSTWKDAAQSCSPALTYSRDTVNNTLRINVCHLSEFALMGLVKYTTM